MIKTQVNGLDAPAFQYLMEKLEAETQAHFYEMFFPQQTTDRLTYEAISDFAGKQVAAFTTTLGTEASEMGYDDIVTLTGKIKPISIKRILNEEDLISLQSNLPAAVQRVREKLYNNIQVCNQGVLNRLDFYAMQLLSKGKIELTANTNAGHSIETIDYGLESWQHANASVAWSTAATADPIKDIKTWVATRRSKGFSTNFILMDDTAFDYLAATTKVVAETTYSVGNELVKSGIVTLAAVNTTLKGARLPQIIIVEDNIQYIKADGTLDTTKRAWNSDMVACLSTLDQGFTLVAPTAEGDTPTIQKVALVSKANGVTMQQYGTMDPVSEITKSKGNMITAWGRSNEILLGHVTNL
jgi:hypothetical protein